MEETLEEIQQINKPKEKVVVEKLEDIVFKTHGYDIKVVELENHKTNGLDASWLSLKFSGKDLNLKLINTLRRASSNNVPTYAIPNELINIKPDGNTTVAFNNDYMRLRLTQLPVLGIEAELYDLHPKYWKQSDVDYSDRNRLKHPSEQRVEFFIDKHNETTQIINVTTHDMTMYINGNINKTYNDYEPILLIKLRPNDKFTCSMNAVLGVGERHAIWKHARNCFYDEKENGDIEFTIEGNFQCHEYDILLKTCKFLINKYNILKKQLLDKIAKKEILPERIINFVLDDEDHTIGEPLNYEFQNHENIISSGLSKPDHLIRSILIRIVASEKVKSPLNPMLESIDILINKFSHIGKQLENLKKKTK